MPLREFVANGHFSVCLTGIARIIYTIRLDVKDLPFSNADPAIWNMVESQVGLVAANVPSMGPLFGKLRNTAKRLHDTYNSHKNKHESHGSTMHTVAQRVTNRGFERMVDDEEVGVQSTAQPGSPKVGKNLTESIPLNDIVVTTNLEQNFQELPSQGRF